MRREKLPTPVFWHGEFRGLYSLWGHKESDTTEQLSLHSLKVMLKILQAKLQQYTNQEFQIVKLDLEKAEEPEIKWPTSVGS